MRITSKGQVTIPADVRERAGLLPNTEVEFVYQRGVVKLVKIRTTTSRRGKAALKKLRGSATLPMTTDEILALTRK